MELKTIFKEPGKARCAENVFREHLSIDHPFLNLPRECKEFNPDEPITEKKK